MCCDAPARGRLATPDMQVLLCLGRPLSQRQLSSKRFTYFVWDLVSPWLALLAVLLAATQHTASPGSQPGLAAAAPSAPLPAPAHRVEQLHPTTSCVGAGAGGGLACALPVTHHGSWQSSQAINPSAHDEGMWHALLTREPLERLSCTPLMHVLLVLMQGHTVLHLWYMATWHSRHTVTVLGMSSCATLGERLRRFPVLAVAWFWLGTGYDVATHAALLWLLGAALVAR
jgi:hypothetical protein